MATAALYVNAGKVTGSANRRLVQVEIFFGVQERRYGQFCCSAEQMHLLGRATLLWGPVAASHASLFVERLATHSFGHCPSPLFVGELEFNHGQKKRSYSMIAASSLFSWILDICYLSRIQVADCYDTLA